MDKSKAGTEEIIAGMKSLGIVRCGATHTVQVKSRLTCSAKRLAKTILSSCR